MTENMMEGTNPELDKEGGKEAASGRRLFDEIYRHKWLILASGVIVAVIVGGISLSQTKQYTADATLLFRDPGYSQGVFGAEQPSLNSSDPTRQAATNVELVRLPLLSARTAKQLNYEFTAKELQDKVKVTGKGESDVVTVSATDTSPEAARRIANTFAAEFIRFRAKADRSKLLTAKRLADREFKSLSPADQQGPRGEQLSRGAERLGILASLQTGNAELVQPAELPKSPSSPKPVRNGIVGLVVGLLAGTVLAFAVERLNRRVREPDEAAAVFGVPVIGVIPDSNSIVRSRDEADALLLPFAEEESFQMIRASLRYFSVDKEVKSVLITSSMAQAGKSTVSWNLARVAAKTSRVVLLETDLRNPTLAKYSAALSGPGLSEVLTHQRQLVDVVQTVPLVNGTDQHGGSLSVITAGSVPPNPAELLESKSMREVLKRLDEEFDSIIIDTPPIGMLSDAFPLLSQVDGVVIVARMYRTTTDSASRLRESLNRLNAPILGVVANCFKAKKQDSYGYSYGHYARAHEQRDRTT